MRIEQTIDLNRRIEMLALISMLGCLLAIGIFIIFKSRNALKMHLKIINAIYEYQLDHLHLEWDGYKKMEDYERTLFKFWDWGCKRILPKEDYQRIEKYIS